MSRQQGCMDVHRSEARTADQGRRQDLSVGHHDQGVRVEIQDASLRGLIANTIRLIEIEAYFERALIDWRWQRFESAPREAVRLGDDEHDIVAGNRELLEAGNREAGGTGEDNSQVRRRRVPRSAPLPVVRPSARCRGSSGGR